MPPPFALSADPSRIFRRRQPLRLCQGFTITEIVMAVAIVLILVAILIPAGKEVMRATLKRRDLNNLKNLGLAHANYLADHHLEVAPGHNPANNRVWFYHLLRPYLDIPLDNTTVGEVFISPLDPSKGGKETLSPIHRRSYAVNRRMLKSNNLPLRLPEVENPGRVFYLIHYNVGKLNTNWCEPTASRLQYLPEDWIPGGYVHLLFLDGHMETIDRRNLMPGAPQFDLFGPAL